MCIIVAFFTNAMFVSSASASIVSITDPAYSGILVEGPNVVLPDGVSADYILGDFNRNPESDTLPLIDSATIYGRIYNCCFDAFIVEVLSTQLFDITVQALGGPHGFNMGVDIWGGATFSGSLDNTTDVLTFKNVGAATFFSFEGLNRNTQWKVGITEVNISEVSAPAAASLTGLALAGMFLRRKKLAS